MHNTLTTTSNNSNNNDNNIQLFYGRRCIAAEWRRKRLFFNIHFPMHNLWYKVLLAGMCQSLLNIKSLVHRLYRSSLCHSGISICTSINDKWVFSSFIHSNWIEAQSNWFSSKSGLIQCTSRHNGIGHKNNRLQFSANHRRFNQSLSNAIDSKNRREFSESQRNINKSMEYFVWSFGMWGNFYWPTE